MQEYSNNSDESFEKNVNLREQIEHYLLNWKWFLASTLIAMIIAFTFLRYAVPMYNATAMVLVKDERKGGLASELSAFSDLGMLKNVKLLVCVTICAPVSAMRLSIAALPVGHATRLAASSRKSAVNALSPTSLQSSAAPR